MEAANPNSRPALADRDARVEDYDVVYVGFPIWWGLAPKLINSFLEAYDFRGKTVVPFATSSGSGIGDVSKYIAPSAPGTDAEIHEFCVLNYKTEFPQMKKSDVNGENELPLYTFLKSKKGFEGFPKGQFSDGMDKMLSKADPDYAKKTDIKWNFTKFVINRDGEVVKRFEPTANMADVEKFVKELL